MPVLRWRDDAETIAGDPAAYRVVVDVTREDALAGRGSVWSSGWVDGDAWDGVPLNAVDMRPSRRYWASMRWRYADGTMGDWATPVTFGTGAGRVWSASAIWGPVRAADADGAVRPSDAGNAAGWAVLRGVIDLPAKPIRWATLNATASSTGPARQFVYRMWLNGRFVGCGPTFPIGGETRYDGYDVTAALRPGRVNAIGVIAYAMEDRRFAAQLDVCFDDGSMGHYGTGPEWLSLPDPAEVWPESASIGTQYFQAPAENVRGDRFPQGFSDPLFDASGWVPAAVKPPFADLAATPTDKLRLAEVPPTSMLRVERPVEHSVEHSVKHDVEQPVKRAEHDDAAADGEPAEEATRTLGVVADFGGAYMGGIRLDLHPRVPIDLTIRYGEVLNPDGSVRYRLSAGNVYEERWHITPGCGPIATWGLRVFRYVEISVLQPPAPPASWNEPSPTGLDERAAAIGEILLNEGALHAEALIHPALEDGTGAGADTGADVGAKAAGSAAHYPGTFHSSDSALNAVWRLSAHTIEALNGNIYADSWTRERAAYEADTWIQQRAHLALDASPSLGAYSVDYLVANRTWPTEWPLYLILAAHDAWMRTGSTAQIAEQYDRLAALLPDRYVDADTGFVVKSPGASSAMDGDLVDWPPSERDGFEFGQVNTVINALASQAYADMVDIARELGRDTDADRFAGIAGRMRVAIHAWLYDADLGAYRDGLRALPGDTGAADGETADGKAGALKPVSGTTGVMAGVATDSASSRDAHDAHDASGISAVMNPDGILATGSGRRYAVLRHAALHSSAFALAFAEVPADRVDRVAAFLRGKGMACSVYAAAPYLLGLYRAGFGADATAMIADRRTTHSWAYMLAQNAGGTMEAWDVARKPNTTYSHPWSASPVFLLAEGLMGVRPLEPGYRRFTVALQPGRVRSARLTLPTPAGNIEVSYRIVSGRDADGARDIVGRSDRAEEHGPGRGTGENEHLIGDGAGVAYRMELDVTVPSRTRAVVAVPQWDVVSLPGGAGSGAFPEGYGDAAARGKDSPRALTVTVDGRPARCEPWADPDGPSDRSAAPAAPGLKLARSLAPGRHRVVVSVVVPRSACGAR